MLEQNTFDYLYQNNWVELEKQKYATNNAKHEPLEMRQHTFSSLQRARDKKEGKRKPSWDLPAYKGCKQVISINQQGGRGQTISRDLKETEAGHHNQRNMKMAAHPELDPCLLNWTEYAPSSFLSLQKVPEETLIIVRVHSCVSPVAIFVQM